MKQKIGSTKPVTEPVSDLDVFFLAVYNLIYEKIETEPNRGIVANKGEPTQRKATWEEVMEIAHGVEDFFILRKVRTGASSCNMCRYWKSVSRKSPHMGECTLKDVRFLHGFNSCKQFDRRNL